MRKNKKEILVSTLSSDEILGENGHKLTETENGIIEMKYCPHCHKWHPLAEYCKCTRNSDGLQSWCKSCNKERYIKTRVANNPSSDLETEQFSETSIQTTTRTLNVILDEIREREQDRDNEISKLKLENIMLKNSQLDIDKLTDRDVEAYLKSHDIPLRILFEAIARREGRYLFSAYDTNTGMTIPIRIEQQVVA